MLPSDLFNENTFLVSADLFVEILDKIRLVKKDNASDLTRMDLELFGIPLERIAELEKGFCHSIRNPVHAQFIVRAQNDTLRHECLPPNEETGTEGFLLPPFLF
jgi:hypothetical protein